MGIEDMITPDVKLKPGDIRVEEIFGGIHNTMNIPNNIESISENYLNKDFINEENIVKDNINKIRKTLDNIVQNGHYDIHKLPADKVKSLLDEYGLIAIDYLMKKVKSMGKTQVYVVPVSYKQCAYCRDFKEINSDFYEYKNILYKDGKLPFCKECIESELLEQISKTADIRESLILMCMKCDVLVLPDSLDSIIDRYMRKEIKRKTLFSNYIKVLNGEIKGKNITEDKLSFEFSDFGGVPFRKYKLDLSVSSRIYDDIFVEEEDSEEKTNLKIGGVIVTPRQLKRLKDKWSRDSEEDIVWLENRYNEWYSKNDINPDKSSELTVKNICIYELLFSEEVRKNKPDTEKLKSLTDSMLKLMSNANWSPKKLKSSKGNSISSLGQLIQRCEDHGPIVNKDPSFVDVDGITRISESMAGALQRTIGEEGPYVEKFLKEYKDYEMNFEDS